MVNWLIAFSDKKKKKLHRRLIPANTSLFVFADLKHSERLQIWDSPPLKIKFNVQTMLVDCRKKNQHVNNSFRKAKWEKSTTLLQICTPWWPGSDCTCALWVEQIRWGKIYPFNTKERNSKWTIENVHFHFCTKKPNFSKFSKIPIFNVSFIAPFDHLQLFLPNFVYVFSIFPNFS